MDMLFVRVRGRCESGSVFDDFGFVIRRDDGEKRRGRSRIFVAR
jgi:hypothetical protein